MMLARNSENRWGMGEIATATSRTTTRVFWIPDEPSIDFPVHP
jgi:hypothetical protein